jgi:hypothetical protein
VLVETRFPTDTWAVFIFLECVPQTQVGVAFRTGRTATIWAATWPIARPILRSRSPSYWNVLYSRLAVTSQIGVTLGENSICSLVLYRVWRANFLFYMNIPIFILGCCILLRIYPAWFPMTPSIATKFQYVNSPFLLFPSHSLHVSAPTGHPQVRYTIRCLQGLFLLQRIRCTYTTWHMSISVLRPVVPNTCYQT